MLSYFFLKVEYNCLTLYLYHCNDAASSLVFWHTILTRNFTLAVRFYGENTCSTQKQATTVNTMTARASTPSNHFDQPTMARVRVFCACACCCLKTCHHLSRQFLTPGKTPPPNYYYFFCDFSFLFFSLVFLFFSRLELGAEHRIESLNDTLKAAYICFNCVMNDSLRNK